MAGMVKLSDAIPSNAHKKILASAMMALLENSQQEVGREIFVCLSLLYLIRKLMFFFCYLPYQVASVFADIIALALEVLVGEQTAKPNAEVKRGFISLQTELEGGGGEKF